MPLWKSDSRVAALDRFSDYPESGAKNIFDWERVLAVIGSGLIASSLAGYKIDDVIFAAGVSDSACSDEEQFSREVKLLSETIRQCEQTRRRLVYFSSAGQVYGSSSGTRDEKSRCEPTSQYGLHKLRCEQLLESSDCSYLIARLANMVGPAQNRRQLVPFLVHQARAGQARLMSRATRDLLGVDRFATILLELLANVGKREMVLLATGISISVVDLFLEIRRILNCQVQISSLDAGDRQEFCVDHMRRLAPRSTGFESNYPYQLLQQYVPELAEKLK